MSAMVVPLKKFITMRRKSESDRSPNSWIRDCSTKKIPGAFQWDGRGKWFVDLDTYDREVKKMAMGGADEVVIDPTLDKLIAALRMSAEDIKAAAAAAR